MRIFSIRYHVFSLVTLLILTVGGGSARADSVSLSNGGFLSGGLVYTDVGGSVNVSESASWSISSTDGTLWTNLNVTAEGFGNLRSLSGVSYLDLGVQTGGLDSTFTGTQYNVHFAIAGTLAQFSAELQALPFGQTIQIPLLTTVADGCANLGSCSEEDISTVVNGTYTSVHIYNIVGPAFLNITNDPGLYDVTLTSTPINQTTPTPEPASLFLLGTGLLGAGVFLKRK